MTSEKRVLLKAIGCLLDYPDEGFANRLDSLKTVLRALPPSAAREQVLEGVGRLAAMAPIVLQEEYTRLFDFNPGMTLELTYHKWGDEKDRGAALAGLQQVYADVGWQSATRELPDYLPRVLEFVSLAPDQVGRRVLDDYRHELAALADRVAATSTIYGPILDVLPRVALDGSLGGP